MPTCSRKTLISAVAGELTLNFVVDKGHGKGRCRPLVCREDKLWLQLCFISIWKQQEGGNTVCVCVCTYCRTAYVGSSHTIHEQ